MTRDVTTTPGSADHWKNVAAQLAEALVKFDRTSMMDPHIKRTAGRDRVAALDAFFSASQEETE